MVLTFKANIYKYSNLSVSNRTEEEDNGTTVLVDAGWDMNRTTINYYKYVTCRIVNIKCVSFDVTSVR